MRGTNQIGFTPKAKLHKKKDLKKKALKIKPGLGQLT
jgi:hypothetical protein